MCEDFQKIVHSKERKRKRGKKLNNVVISLQTNEIIVHVKHLFIDKVTFFLDDCEKKRTNTIAERVLQRSMLNKPCDTIAVAAASSPMTLVMFIIHHEDNFFLIRRR